MKCLVLLVILMMDIAGTDVSNRCADQQYSPLCFCRVSYTNSSFIDLFLARLILSQCENSLPIHHCGQSQFNPPSFRLTQLIPQVTNLSHCLEDVNCLHILHSRQHCQQCQLIHNDSSYTETCFNFCEHNPSCGIICLNQSILISINCSQCHEQEANISCR
jgi:hypothetical protein